MLDQSRYRENLLKQILAGRLNRVGVRRALCRIERSPGDFMEGRVDYDMIRPPSTLIVWPVM